MKATFLAIVLNSVLTALSLLAFLHLLGHIIAESVKGEPTTWVLTLYCIADAVLLIEGGLFFPAQIFVWGYHACGLLSTILKCFRYTNVALLWFFIFASFLISLGFAVFSIKAIEEKNYGEMASFIVLAIVQGIVISLCGFFFRTYEL